MLRLLLAALLLLAHGSDDVPTCHLSKQDCLRQCPVIFNYECRQRQIPAQHHPRGHHLNGPSKRLVLFSADGLRAESFYQLNPDGSSRAPFLYSLITKGQARYGISHTRVPTESRPGHVAMIAGLYEDVSAVTRGWTENPVDFDSVFNQSSTTLAFGSPDILDMFSRRSPSRVKAFTYDARLEDFAGNASGLDTWVFRRATAVVESTDGVVEGFDGSQYHSYLDASGSVLFLHLLGLDTHGHGFKPWSREYIENIRLVDDGIASLYRSMERYYPDSFTTYLFTSDHGMTDWGSHGMGLAHETQTPFVVWGAGVELGSGGKAGRTVDLAAASEDDTPGILNLRGRTADLKPDQIIGVDSGIFSPQDFGKSVYEKLGFEENRIEIEQADIAPLMAGFLGLNMPMHSVGILPLDLIAKNAVSNSKNVENSGDLSGRTQDFQPEKFEYKFEAAVANWNQLSELYLGKKTGIQKTSFSAFFKDYPGFTFQDFENVNLDLLAARHSKSFERGVESVVSNIRKLRNAYDYFCRYDRPFLTTLVIAGFTAYFTYVLRGSDENLTTAANGEQERVAKKFYLFFPILLLSSFAGLFALNYSWTVYVYTVILAYFLARHLAMPKPRLNFASARVILLFFGLTEILVLAFFRRAALSILLPIGSWVFFRLSTSGSGISRKIPWTKCPYGLLMLICAIFPLLPTIGSIARPSLVAFSGWLIGLGVLVANYTFVSRNEPYLDAIGWLILATAFVGYINSGRVAAKLGASVLAQIFSWVILLAAFTVPYVAKVTRKSNFGQLEIVMGFFYLPYLLLSINYEAIFYPIYCALLIVWRNVSSKNANSVQGFSREILSDNLEDSFEVFEPEPSTVSENGAGMMRIAENKKTNLRWDRSEIRQRTILPSGQTLGGFCESRPKNHDDTEFSGICDRDCESESNLKNSKLSEDLKMAFSILTLAFYSFFGTGNLASLNSFNPSAVQTFLTVFNPFLMGALLMLKQVIPFLILMAAARSIPVSPRLFWAVLALSDFMSVNFFLLLKDSGSWLEIGTSISHYVISMLSTLVLLLLYFWAGFYI